MGEVMHTLSLDASGQCVYYSVHVRPEDRPLVDALYIEIDYLVDQLRLYKWLYGDLPEGLCTADLTE